MFEMLYGLVNFELLNSEKGVVCVISAFTRVENTGVFTMRAATLLAANMKEYIRQFFDIG